MVLAGGGAHWGAGAEALTPELTRGIALYQFYVDDLKWKYYGARLQRLAMTELNR